MDTDKIVRQCKQEFDTAIAYKQGRIKDWNETEDQYFGRLKKALKGTVNISPPVMAGFIDTLTSKVSESSTVKFSKTKESELRMELKTQALYERIKRSGDPKFSALEKDGKKLGSMYGRAIFKAYGESDPHFRFRLFNTDPYDFYIEGKKGYTELARYLGEDNIFLSKSQLVDGANNGRYDRKAVHELVNNLAENVKKESDIRQQDKQNRLSALGLSTTTEYQGEGMVRFVESGTIVNGKRYHVIWNYETCLAALCRPNKEDFESDLWCWTSWATNRDSFNFWSKAPADDMRQVHEAIRILVSQELTNRMRRNMGQRAYDPDVFPDASDLEYRQDGLVAVKCGASKVAGGIASGIYSFETPEMRGSIDLAQWLDSFYGLKSGITASAQGQSADQKVGIYQGNIAQIADRLSLINDSYSECQEAIGRRFLHACKEHINKAEAVKLIGEKGVEWDELKGSEVNPDMEILVETNAAELQINEMKKQKRAAGVTAIMGNPTLMRGLNPQWANEQILLNSEYTDEEVRVALDVENNGNREVLSRASEAIEDIVEGKTPKLFRGATTAFQQKILDFAADNTDGDLGLFNRLVAYSDAHNEIVMTNMTRRAMQARAQAGMGAPMVPGQPAPGSEMGGPGGQAIPSPIEQPQIMQPA